MTPIHCVPVGDRALSVTFPQVISPDVNQKIRALSLRLSEEAVSGVVEVLPTYCSLFVHYRPEQVGYQSLVEKIMLFVKNIHNDPLPSQKIVEIPVLYGGAFGEDLHVVANHNHLTEEEVISYHSSNDYLIYMLGFTPGFPYLGGMDPRISAPRLSTPRLKNRAGSVGIAGSQTGIYPSVSPGGWQIIGTTPLKLYDPDKESPFFLESGQYLRFRPIFQEEFQQISSQVENGTYQVGKEDYIPTGAQEVSSCP